MRIWHGIDKKCCGAPQHEYLQDVKVNDSGSIENFGPVRLECSCCGATTHHGLRRTRPENFADSVASYNDAQIFLEDGGCVWLMDFAENDDCPDYPIEDAEDLHWAMSEPSEQPIILWEHRSPDTIAWDRQFPDLLHSIFADWRRGL